MSDAEDRIARYADALRTWGRRTNLTGSVAPDAIRDQIDQSLAAAPHLPKRAAVVDLGSGAGLPGVPIAIARPDLQLTLVEIRERRVHFLRHVARAVPVDCEVLRTRIEPGPGHPEYQVALLRAVAPLRESIRLGRIWASDEVWVWTREPPPDPADRISTISLGSRGQILRIRAAPSSEPS